MSRGCVWNQALVELSPASEVLVGCSSGLEAAFEQVLVEPSGAGVTSSAVQLLSEASLTTYNQTLLSLQWQKAAARGATASVV